MRRLRWAPLGLGVVVLGVALAPSAASAAAPIPLRQYVQRAEQACRAADRASDKIDLPSDDAAVPAWFDQYAAISTTLVQRLQAIPLPGSRREPAKELRAFWPQQLQLVQAMQRELHAGATYPQVLRKHDKRLTSLSRSVNRRWTALGATACLDDQDADEDG